MELLSALSGDVPEVDAIGTRILDAAYAVICRVGAQRMTMEEVARTAGISRITVYRRFAGKDALVEQVITREFRRYFDQFRADVAHGRTAGDRVVLGFVSSLRTMRDNPVIGGLMSGERGLFLTSLLAEGATLDAVRGFVAQQLRREQQAGHISSEVDPDLVAEIMVRLTTSFLVTPSTLVDVDDEAALRRVAEQALVPLLVP
ncbi:MAG TPA: helix-turn-helix domain-containing protein [Nocardioides sp.]|nr:helix-turn-helix domain-containing protein [Nocardioides sp.]